MSSLLGVRFPLSVQAHFRTGQAVILGLQRGHSPEAGGLHGRSFRLGVWSQRLIHLAERNFELASSWFILQDGGKVFWGSVSVDWNMS